MTAGPGWDFPKLKTGEHLTDHFGLVSDFLSECWNKLRSGSRVNTLQGRIYWGEALSGRDIEATNKTVSGLLKLLYPDATMPVPDENSSKQAQTRKPCPADSRGIIPSVVKCQYRSGI